MHGAGIVPILLVALGSRLRVHTGRTVAVAGPMSRSGAASVSPHWIHAGRPAMASSR